MPSGSSHHGGKRKGGQNGVRDTTAGEYAVTDLDSKYLDQSLEALSEEDAVVQQQLQKENVNALKTDSEKLAERVRKALESPGSELEEE